MAIARSIPLGLGLCGVLLLGGCNLFQPRTPEPPSTGGVVTNYTDPAATLETLARAIEAKAAGNSPSAYMGGLADSITARDAENFIAFFDPEAVTVWRNVTGGTPPNEWGPPLEKQLFTHLPDLSGDVYSFVWYEDFQHPNDEDPAPNVKVLHRQYVLTATPKGGTNAQTLAIGYADLTFILSKSGDKWVIARWQDRVDPTVGANPSSGNQSFSALRLSHI